MRWTKAKANFLVDTAIMLAFLGEVVSGIVLWIVLPSGGFRGGLGVDTLRVFIFDRAAWRELHNWLAVTMVAGIGLHVVLHWNWIVCTVRRMWREAFPPRLQPVPVKEGSEL